MACESGSSKEVDITFTVRDNLGSYVAWLLAQSANGSDGSLFVAADPPRSKNLTKLSQAHLVMMKKKVNAHAPIEEYLRQLTIRPHSRQKPQDKKKMWQWKPKSHEGNQVFHLRGEPNELEKEAIFLARTLKTHSEVKVAVVLHKVGRHLTLYESTGDQIFPIRGNHPSTTSHIIAFSQTQPLDRDRVIANHVDPTIYRNLVIVTWTKRKGKHSEVLEQIAVPPRSPVFQHHQHTTFSCELVEPSKRGIEPTVERLLRALPVAVEIYALKRALKELETATEEGNGAVLDQKEEILEAARRGMVKALFIYLKAGNCSAACLAPDVTPYTKKEKMQLLYNVKIAGGDLHVAAYGSSTDREEECVAEEATFKALLRPGCNRRTLAY